MCSKFLDIIRLLVKISFCSSSCGVFSWLECLQQALAADLRGKKYSDTFKHKTVFSVPLSLMRTVPETI